MISSKYGVSKTTIYNWIRNISPFRFLKMRLLSLKNIRWVGTVNLWI